jgi:hypothetical protein
MGTDELHEVGLPTGAGLLEQMLEMHPSVVFEIPNSAAMSGTPPVSTIACMTRTSARSACIAAQRFPAGE